MLAYAASRPPIAERRSSPNTMLSIIAAHVALLAIVMSAKMELPRTDRPARSIVELDRPPKPPPPEPVASSPRPRPHTRST